MASLWHRGHMTLPSRSGMQTLMGHSGPVSSVAFSSDGQFLASGSGDDTIRIWDAVTGRKVQTINSHSGWIYNISFTTDSSYLNTDIGLLRLNNTQPAYK